MIEVCVVGLGYIGLPTATLLAHKGYSVRGLKLIRELLETINSGGVHIIEPDLEEYVEKAVTAGKLRAHIPQEADIYIICVPTPFYDEGETPEPNLEYVISAVTSIAPLIKAGDIVILESTSPVGTTNLIAEILLSNDVVIDDVAIVLSGKVLPGKVIVELISNDRIVGGLNDASAEKVKCFYETFVDGAVLTCSSKTAGKCASWRKIALEIST